MRWGVRTALGFGLGTLTLLAASRAEAQWSGLQEADLPRHIAERVLDFFDDPAVERFDGSVRVGPDEVLRRDVAVWQGSITVGGLVDGEVVVVDGDLVLEPGGEVTGDVTVVGGRVRGRQLGTIRGTVEEYAWSWPADRRSPGRRWRDRSGDGDRGRDRGRDRDSDRWEWGHSRITVRAGPNYNRVEGLPLQVGPYVRTGGPAPFSAEAVGIWRTENGFDSDPDLFGYRVRVEQRIGRDAGVGVGGTLFSTIDPIESWGLTDLEASLATLLGHEDFRDYVERTGWSAFLSARSEDRVAQLRFDYREDRHAFAPARNPFALGDDDRSWRPQPLVGEGESRSVGADLTLDLRNDPERPSDGWYLRLKGRKGVGGVARLPAFQPEPGGGPAQPVVPSRDLDAGFADGFVDVRRYARLAPNAELGLRVVAAGSLTNDPLPPQYQHALGGAGSLPGHGLFSMDCGARSVRVTRGTPGPGAVAEPAFPGYGCDRIALVQVEYRGSLFFHVGDDDWDDEWSWGSPWDVDLQWVAFFDAGRGWALDNPAGAAGAAGPAGAFARTDTETLYDLGLGLDFGDGVSLMLAFPLNGEDPGNGNLFIRLSRRF